MSTKGITRRGALARVAISGLQVGCAAIALPSTFVLAAERGSAGQPLVLPEGPMRLTRVLTRELRGSAQLRVSRAWQVDFADSEQGIVVSGFQISARVDAPPALAGMADLEEKRDTNDLFPILLSEHGRIIAAGASTRKGDLNEAVRRAEIVIAGLPIPTDEKAQHLLFLAQLQRSGASLLDEMPQDLFFPTGEPVRSSEEIRLPGGVFGEFEVRYEAFTRPGIPWLHHAVREVETRVGLDSRLAIEEWGLEPLGQVER